MKKKLLFMGTPGFAVSTLKALVEQNTFSITVVTKPDKARGRGKKISASEIKQVALEQNLPVYTPKNKDELTQVVNNIQPDLIIVIAYYMILPKRITDTYYCINCHASLLPQLRGASPIQSSLLHRDKKTGITLIKMNEKMDEGDILSKREHIISPEETYAELSHALSLLSASLLCELLSQYPTLSKIPRTKQNQTKASYCHKLDKADRQLNPTDPIQKKLGQIKAFSPKPGAFLIQERRHIKIIDACIAEKKLVPLIVQPEGKKPMSYKAYQQGYPSDLLL